MVDSFETTHLPFHRQNSYIKRAFGSQEKEVRTFLAEVIYVKLYSFLLFIILSLQAQPDPTTSDCHRNTRSIWDAWLLFLRGILLVFIFFEAPKAVGIFPYLCRDKLLVSKQYSPPIPEQTDFKWAIDKILSIIKSWGQEHPNSVFNVHNSYV